MPFFFTPPTVDEGPAGGARLFWFYKITRGDSLIKRGYARYERLRTPSQDDFFDNTVYQGGHIYEITADEKASLEAAGYGAYITERA